jgi:tRNA (guanine26-N2/guanine27-N2)-dimethyltransferase
MIMEKKDLTLMREGLAEFYIYNYDKDSIPSKSMNVFYNKKMLLNRDISNLAINAFRKLFKQDALLIVDSMAASGVGAIRMLKECKYVKEIYINDINPEAVKLINKNLKLNKFDNSYIQIEVFNKDANLLFSEIAINTRHRKRKPNIISIDPFGTPNLYIDSAFKALQKVNGLICITATDTAVLFGVRPKACKRKYLSKPLHTEYCKEIGARILLHFIFQIANINKMGIIPLLTFYSGHFIRLFCLSYKDIKKITKSFNNIGFIIHCNKCGYRKAFASNILEMLERCPICKDEGDLDYAGPLWIGKIHHTPFIHSILKYNQKFKYKNKNIINKILTYAIEENNMPVSFYNVHKLCHNLKLPSVPKIEDIITKIKEMGYQASRTHFDFLSIKTDLDLQKIKNSIINLIC